MMPYYHASIHQEESWDTLDAVGNYEAIGPSGCPEPIYAGGSFIGFKSSKIDEICFSKSMEGAILGKARFCERGSPCTIDIYSTEERPDVDISDCSFDFSLLEEVRYRRTIPVQKVKTVVVPKIIVDRIAQAYWDDWDYDMDTPSEPNLYALEKIKKRIRKEVR